MSTSNSLPSQGNQQGPCVPLPSKPKVTGRELAAEGDEKVSQYLCRCPDCTKEFITVLGLCKKHSAEVCALFANFYTYAMTFVETLAQLGIADVGVSTGDPFLARCDRFLNDAAPNWFDDVDAWLNNQAARKTKTERRKRGGVTAVARETHPLVRRARAS